ncbi:drug resistance transporter, EmrB/QacA subfamily [Streptomyces sp. 2131.1]|nr:drug resistance transporter, EmrB/QacA subfamily [Streptomyces sp. 2131.1]
MLAAALTATFMASFDLFIVNVATETLRADLGASDAELGLVVSGYAFTYAAGLVTGGRLGDRYGYRRIFVTGMASFTFASLLCGLAQSPALLVVGRLAQGLAAAAMVPQVLSLVTARFPAAHRGRATAWHGAVSGLGAIAGQLAGGLLLEANILGLGWRVVFLVNVPVGAAACMLAGSLLPGLVGAQHRFDPVGAIAVTLTLALILAPLSLGRDEGWPVWTWACLAASAPALWLTLCWQRTLRAQGGEPVLDPAFFRNRPYMVLVAAVGLFQLYFGAYMFTLALLLQAGLEASPLTAALVFLPQAVLYSIGSLLSGRLTARHGTVVPGAGGMLIILGLGLLAAQLVVTGNRMEAVDLIPSLILVGLGNGLLLPALMGTALSHVGPREAGAASGALNTIQQSASSVGVALFGTLFFSIAGPGLGDAHTAMATVTLPYIALTAASVALQRTSWAKTPALPRTEEPMSSGDEGSVRNQNDMPSCQPKDTTGTGQ